ncbi:MAG: SusC/RagA family TonB-linked outer membrane protein, partial [Gemmatimonadetes bacterium]|nr:SusC/RagA family TonB-linked outer membrane protein [Gemmatimonadota bacterium]
MVNLCKSRWLFLFQLAAFVVLSGTAPATASAQENFGSVIGSLTAEGTGNPLGGGNVYIVGTGLGTLTNESGAFLIEQVPPGTYELEFSYVSYATQRIQFTVAAGQRATVTAALGLDPLMLDEIVVTGYGTARKEELTGSMVSISAQDLEMVQSATFQDVIQGSPGVLVTSRDGAPGAGINIRVRGIGSITAGSEPLYVIDGVPLFNNPSASTEVDLGGRNANTLASLNPNDIESLVVLKDAASTAIYGSRGANGVVLITTKGGVEGSPIWASEPKFQLRSQVGVSDWAHGNLIQGLNFEEYKDYYLTARVNDGLPLADAQAAFANDYPLQEDNDWRDLTSRNGVSQQIDLSASGGSGRFTYYVSAGMFKQQGNILRQYFDRYSSRINLSARLTDKFTLANNLSLAQTYQNGIVGGSSWESLIYMWAFMPPVIPIKDEDGFWYHRHTSSPRIMGGNHPLGGLYENPKLRDTRRVIENISGVYRFNDQFSLSSAWSFDLYAIHDDVYQNMFFGDGRNFPGTFDDSRVENLNWQGSHTLTYTNAFENVHNVDAVVGYEESHNERLRTNGWGNTFAHPSLKTGSSAATTFGTSTKAEFAFQSVFTRVNYDYDRTYFLSGSFRTDAPGSVPKRGGGNS